MRIQPWITLGAKPKKQEATLPTVLIPAKSENKPKRKSPQAADNRGRINAGLPIVNCFEDITRQWLESSAHTVRDFTNQKKVRRFELYVFPEIDQKPIGEVKSPDVFAIVRPLIVKKQLETAHQVRADISAASAYVIAHGFTDYDPTQVVGAQIPAQKVKHNATITEPRKLTNSFEV